MAFLSLSSNAVAAQDDGGSVPEEKEEQPGEVSDEILVVAERLALQIDTEQAPILELDEGDIAAYGVSSIADLVEAIEPATGSSRGRGGGRPAFLVNGIRIGSFRELRSYPPEAIRKVEVLPEETAQKFGFPPDRRVINFILKDNYSAITGELEYEQPDRGGYSRTEQEATLLKITKGGRLNFNAELNDTTLLTEAERNIDQTTGGLPTVPGDPDPAAFRSLIADSSSLEATANYATAIQSVGGSLSLNAAYNRNNSRSLSGLDSVVLTDPGDPDRSVLRTFNQFDPLESRTQSDTYSSSLAYSMPVGEWQLTATADGTYSDSITEIDKRADVSQLLNDVASGRIEIDAPLPTIVDAGFDTAERDTYTFDSKATLRGSPFYLPAGDVNATINTGYKWNRIESADSRAGSDLALQRGNFDASVGVSVPLTSRRDDVLAAVGTITATAQAGINVLSDFGTLFDWTAGLNWSPSDNLDLQATYVWKQVQPSLSQLGNPQIVTLNVPTFDFATGDTVLAEITSGGNPALQAETQSDWNFAANWELPFIENARLRLEYSRNRSNDVSTDFPILTPEIEAAFPDRVTRDANNRLIAIDRRAIDYFETRSERLSFGLFLRGSVGAARPQERPAGGGFSQRRGGGQTERGRGPAAGGDAGGPPDPERRARLAAFRERICGEDGEEFLIRLARTIDSGEAVEGVPDFDPQRAQRLLERLRGENGEIDRAKLSQFREMMCSRSPGAGREGAESGRSGGGENAGGRRRGGGSPMARAFGGGDGRGRYFVNLTHTVELERTILVAPNGPLLDLLDGDSISAFGNPRNSTRLEGGLFWKGLGMRLSGQYSGSSRIDGSGAPGSTTLFVDDLATFDLRLFADLQEVFKQDRGVLKGARLSFRFDNIFDGRRIVRDEAGEIPLSYQPLLIDPTGRYLGVELRKMF